MCVLGKTAESENFSGARRLSGISNTLLPLIQFRKGFRSGWAYKRRGLYLRGLVTGIKKNVSKRAVAAHEVQIDVSVSCVTNFVITDYFDNVMTKFIVNNSTDA